MSLPSAFPFNDRSRTIVVVSVLLPAIATLTVIGRFVARHLRKVGYGMDDWIIIPALFAVYAQMMLISLSTIYGGIGHHIDEVGPDNVVIIYKILAGTQFTFGTSLGLVKISICFLLIRIFFSRPFRIAAYIVMGYCVCWMIMVISIGAGLCRPFAHNWNHSIQGICGKQDAAYISIAALDIVGDIAIIVLPMPMIWHLQIGLATKIGLSLLFALGFLNVIVAILRIVYLTQLDLSPGADFTYNGYGTWLWSIIEPSLAIIVACCATLKPLLEWLFPRLKSFAGTNKTSRDRAYASRGAQRLDDLTSESNVPLRDIKGDARLGLGQSSTRAVGRSDSFTEPRVNKIGRENDDAIWMQRDISVRMSKD